MSLTTSQRPPEVRTEMPAEILSAILDAIGNLGIDKMTAALLTAIADPRAAKARAAEFQAAQAAAADAVAKAQAAADEALAKATTAETDIATKHAALDQRQAQLDAQEQQLKAREAEVANRATDLATQLAGIDQVKTAALDEVRTQREELESSRSQHAADMLNWTAQVEEGQAKFLQSKVDADRRNAALDEREKMLANREAALKTREEAQDLAEQAHEERVAQLRSIVNK